MKKIIVPIALAAFILPLNLHARSQVRGVGSSTVYPFVTTAAENFGSSSEYKTPIIESTGTGGGFKFFCGGIGVKHPDISNASREMKSSEKTLCAKNGVDKISEIKIGYDGIVVANSVSAQEYSLTLEQLYLGVAKYIPSNGGVVKNQYKTWSDIDSSLPNKKIEVYGPPPTSGTRDAFVELVLQKTCMKLKEFKRKYPGKSERKNYCSQVREDGGYINSGENDNLLIHKLDINRDALGIFGYSFLENNAATVQGANINGFSPTFENISDGSYPISRSLFVYVKEGHYKLIDSLEPFIRELVSEDAIGEEGYLTFKGLIPLPSDELELVQETTLKNL